MATPSIKINIISINEVDKKIFYEVDYSEEVHFDTNEDNYYGYINGTDDAYVGYSYAASGNITKDSVSYETEYDNYKTSITFSVTYKYYKEYIVQNWDGTYSRYGNQSYGSESDAENDISRFTGGNSLYKVSGNVASGFYIEKKNCTYTIKKLTIASEVSDTVTVDFPPKQQTSNPTCETSFNDNQITVAVSNLKVGDTAWFYLREKEDENGSYDSYRVLSYTRSDDSDSSSISWTETVEYNISYKYSVIIQPGDIYLVEGKIFTLENSLFEWTTKIYYGAKISSWQNQANGNTHPAPVTADEWNRLVTLVNVKCGTSIDTVSQGERMYAGPGSKIRQVADALEVSVDNGDRITAAFFLALQDAINNIK